MRLLLVLLMLWAVPAWALDAQQVSKTLRITYDEPTENADLTPLADLAETRILVVTDGTPMPEMVIPATAPSGGGSISQDVTVPFTPNTLVNVDIEVTAVDTSGNASEIVPANITIDWLPPGKVK